MLASMHDRQALGAFLKSRRARLTPETSGPGAAGRRRVPGLRRQEVAERAGISVEYYQRLEQGRVNGPSDAVLDAIAAALCLSPVEHRHLGDLARPGRPTTAPHPIPPTAARPELVRMLGRLTIPGLVINDRFDVLALNALGRRLFGPATAEPSGRWNLARYLFLDPAARTFYVEWPQVAAATAGQLRDTAARFPSDRELALLIADLHAGSADFAGLWDRGDVEIRTHGTKTLRHPALGILAFSYENFDLAGNPRQRLVALDPEPDGPTEAALHLMASWSAPEAAWDKEGPAATAHGAARIRTNRTHVQRKS